ncbi:bacitracin resistance BacA family protein [Candidatus Endolissoclinum faulkneri L2]|uniref:Undecaprenyl-diphosphatase n=1 Tax=Candidatus Endolissoclinum faulkneri L2 TaxID=1193729 RepID=K7Z616_9PROT|nr:undecaprenyl-diphosphate phosphatase [Candidatus Endolissoclinum faulkneri]AFX99573.1 bacitracin resistance BacA family protein [Candidatus Endolissoclinum faulkneri L2]
MSIDHIIFIALIQGVTEFLPISSSGHLIMIPTILGTSDQGMIIDVAVHMGTLLAVCLYLWRYISRIILGSVRGYRDPDFRLTMQIILASISVICVGSVVKYYIDDIIRSPKIVAWATLGFGILLGVVDRFGMTSRRIEHMSYRDALIIGFAQVLALIPGTSRSGITITVSRALGYERQEATRFSMLIGIPTILAAGTAISLDLYNYNDLQLTIDACLAGGLSFFAALISITLMMNWLKCASFFPFVIYRILFGSGWLIWLYKT